jgi:UDP-N-acetylmuramyl pentapeptide phosphotransferase/UDP-N-acetylglucosamine-1-phosphate transferase
MDKPNERSMHVIPTLRGGGLIFIVLFLIGIPVLGYLNNSPIREQVLLFTCVFLLAVINFFDDLYNLPAKPRFAVQCVVAGLVSVAMKPQSLDFVLFTLSNTNIIKGVIFFMILWAINHFNFMDGLDGYCGTQALFLFVSYALMFCGVHALFYQDLCLILVFGLIGFLAFNLPPAKLFMGDVGSATLGFISFYMAVVAQQKYHIPMVYWFILNGLFLFDSTFTIFRRMYKKEKWFAAHRKHAYQRLKQYGLNSYYILFGQLIINLFLFTGVFLLQKNMVSPSGLLLFLISMLFSVYLMVEHLFPMFKRD